MTITMKQVIQIFAPFRLEGDDLREFIHTLKGLRKTDDLVLELHIGTGASGYGRVVHEEPGLIVTEASVEFPRPTGDFGEGEVATAAEAVASVPDAYGLDEETVPEAKRTFPQPGGFVGRAKLDVKPAEPKLNGLEEALKGRLLLPHDVSFNGRALEAIRSRERMSQDQLADKIGLTGGAVGYWERNTGKPSIANVRALADAIGVSVDKLLTVRR